MVPSVRHSKSIKWVEGGVVAVPASERLARLGQCGKEFKQTENGATGDGVSASAAYMTPLAERAGAFACARLV